MTDMSLTEPSTPSLAWARIGFKVEAGDAPAEHNGVKEKLVIDFEARKQSSAACVVGAAAEPPQSVG